MGVINFLKKENDIINRKLESYASTENCHICKEKFKQGNADNNKYLKVRDHCYYTGKYKAAAHSTCYCIRKEIPIV